MRWWTAVLVLALGALVTAASAAAVVEGSLFAPPEHDGPLIVLVLGSDSGPFRAGTPLDGRADGLQLVVVSPDRRNVSILGFPRDSYVAVPGMGTTKINGCLNGGPQRCVEAVEGVTGLDVDHWLLTDFRGLVAGVELYGGIPVDVERRLHDRFSGSDLQPGRQVLDGGQALAYSRDRRSRPDGDLGRTAAHAELLTAVHEAVAGERPTVTRVAEMVELLRSTTVSDLDAATQLRLAYLAVSIPPEHVRTLTLPGRTGTAGGASVVFLTDAAHAVFADVRGDGVLGEPSPPPAPPPTAAR